MSLATAMRFYEAYNRHDASLLDGVLAPEYVGNVNGRVITGPEAAIGFVSAFLAAFPDLQYVVEDTVVQGDKVVARWTATATQRGAFAGIAPTDKAVTMTGITIFQTAGDQIVALWNTWDVAGLVGQLQAA